MLVGLFLNAISKATSQFSNLQKIASILAAKQVSKQSQRTPINPICQPCCLSYLELALSRSIARKHVFFVFVFEVGGKYGIEERGGKKGGGGAAYQTEVAYICDHGPMFFLGLSLVPRAHSFFCSGLRALGQKAERMCTGVDTRMIWDSQRFLSNSMHSQTRRPPRKRKEE